MAVYFRNRIDENSAFERIDLALSSNQGIDGYCSVRSDHAVNTFSWPRDMSVETFKSQIVDSLRTVWEGSPYWSIYERSDNQNDLTASEITTAAIQLSGGYPGAAVVTLSLLGHEHSAHDLELVFLCFKQEAERRNFQARYEGKFVST
jgi:hypothetical protein